MPKTVAYILVSYTRVAEISSISILSVWIRLLVTFAGVFLFGFRGETGGPFRF